MTLYRVIISHQSFQGGPMRTLRFWISILVLCGIAAAAAAADSTSAPSATAGQTPSTGTPAVAPAPATTPPALQEPVVAKAPAAKPLDISWYGMAMLRFREEIVTNKEKTTTTDILRGSANLSQRIAYRLGAKFKPNDEVLLQFEIGNNWFATEEVTGIPAVSDNNKPWFNQAYVQWDPGYFHMAAGIFSVNGTALMDLLGVSIIDDKRYKYASHLSWGITTNFSQTGLRVGMPILKDDFKLGVDVMTAVINQRTIGEGKDTMNFNAPAWEILLEVPMQMAGLSINPQFYAIPYRTYNKVTYAGDFEYGAGIDLGYKINDNIKLRAGFGIAQNSNIGSAERNDSLFIRLGTNSNIGATINLGPGKLDVDISLSSEYDGKDTTINDLYPFIDLKYGWMVNKNFTIMPRCRLFVVLPHSSSKYSSKITTRPEIILTGSF